MARPQAVLKNRGSPETADDTHRRRCKQAAIVTAETTNLDNCIMAQVVPSETDQERAGGKKNDAAIVFARATRLYSEGQLDRAIELFDEVIAMSGPEDPQRDVACVAAHISLYKIHRALAHEREANEHFNKAVSLGANARRLQES